MQISQVSNVVPVSNSAPAGPPKATSPSQTPDTVSLSAAAKSHLAKQDADGDGDGK